MITSQVNMTYITLIEIIFKIQIIQPHTNFTKTELT